MVHLLPFERYDLYKAAVSRITAMSSCLSDHNLCQHFKAACLSNANLPVPGDEAEPEAANENDLIQLGAQEEPLPVLNSQPDQVLGDRNDIMQFESGSAEAGEAAKVVESEEPIALVAENRKKAEKVKKSKKREVAVLACPWTKNHESKASLQKDGTILKIPVEDKFGVPAAGLQVLTRRTYRDILINNKENVQEKSDKKLIELAQEISRKLTDEVFSEEGKAVIGHTRTILDFARLAIKVRNGSSAVKVAVTEFNKWLEAVQKIPVKDLEDISRDELKAEYRLFVTRLELHAEKFSIKELEDLDSKVLIKKFFDEDNKSYEGIEMVLHAVAVASVKSSCESILESFVSQYENHFDERRNVDEQTATEEFEISVNGPSLSHADSVITEAMDLYWKDKPWRFIRTSH